MQVTVPEVQQVFAKLTRYPLDILLPDADLEEELGIDSVKQMEILASFKDKYSLPDSFQVGPEDLRTISDITLALQGAVEEQNKGKTSPIPSSIQASVSAQVTPSTDTDVGLNGEKPTEANPSLPSGSLLNGQGPTNGAATHNHILVNASATRVAQPSTQTALSEAEMASLVIDVMENVTRYPRELLQLEADLEEDLGIDSVKMAEALSVLAEKLSLPPNARAEGVSIRTLSDVVIAANSMWHEHHGQRRAEPMQSRASIPLEVVEHVPAPDTKPKHQQYRPLDGKVALVTGSGHGIGQAIVEQLAELGAHVLVNSFHSRLAGEGVAQGLRGRGLKATHLWGSVAQPEQLDKLFQTIDEQFGQLDFFVSNASNGMLGPLSSITASHWDKAFRTNVVALHQGALLAAEMMKKQGGGKIVTLSSPGAQRYIEHFGCMGPIKAAVESLTRYLAIELGDFNIQVNSVSAGPIYGELLDKYPESKRLVPYWESLSAGGRLGEAADVANFVAYLLSPAANKISGSVLLVDAGGSQRI